MLLLLTLACSGTEPNLDDSALGDGDSADTAGSDTSSTGTLHGATPPVLLDVPEFAAINRDGSARSQSDLVGHPTVVWFYPSAGTLG